MNKKYIFVDVDGTILNHETRAISSKTKEAIKILIEKGHELYLCTGRNYTTAKFDLGVDVSGYVLSMGACVIKNDKVIYDNPIPEELKNEVFEIGAKYNMDINPEAFTYCYGSEEVLDIVKRCYDDKTAKFWLKKELYQNEQVYKMLALSNNLKEYQAFKKHFEGRLQFLNSFPNRLYDEVQLPENSKGNAIKALSLKGYLKLDDTICIGDASNDISMFKVCNYKIAMGNGIKELKELADYVTSSVGEEGFYNAFKKLGYLD